MEAAMIALDLIDENEAALRSVDKSSEDYQALVDSIRSDGVLNGIAVSPIEDTEPQRYRLVDGLHRFSAAQDAGLADIPATIKAVSETEAMYAQIIANVHKIETKPAEYASHLQRILSGNPTMTMTDLAGKLARSVTWLTQMLKLNKLHEKVKALVDDGKIVLVNAQSLAKLPQEEQLDYLEAAQTEKSDVFAPKIAERARAIRQAAKEGKSADDAEFKPVEHMRKAAEVKDLRADPSKVKAAMSAQGATDAVQFTLDYILCMDDASVAQQEADEVARKKQRDEDKEKRKVERADKKAVDAKAEADKIRKDHEEAEAAKAAK